MLTLIYTPYTFYTAEFKSLHAQQSRDAYDWVPVRPIGQKQEFFTLKNSHTGGSRYEDMNLNIKLAE